MEVILETKCGCKGIRTCLICEKQNAICSSSRSDEDIVIYTYCHHCNLCWPDAEDLNRRIKPFYLGDITLVPEFLNSEEEDIAACEIDRITWMPSQSGRRKQDFGPKVNFKRKKVKIGNFKGFPAFAKVLLRKIQKIPKFSDFAAVELCDLEYSPERGSAIDPHLDDSWLWGERLVTLNLLSSTVLTLTPAATDTCSCASPSLQNNMLHHPCDTSHDTSYILDESCVKSVAVENEYTTCWNIQDHQKTMVRIHLPPRSLLVLAGCARHNWFHEIKRQDVKARRLAMTFRELSSEFLDGGKEADVGRELLAIADIQLC